MRPWRSARPVAWLAARDLRGMNAGVPSSAPSWVIVVGVWSGATDFARPKSSTFTRSRPDASTTMIRGLQVAAGDLQRVRDLERVAYLRADPDHALRPQDLLDAIT